MCVYLITPVLYTHLSKIKWGFIIAELFCQNFRVQFIAEVTGNHEITSTFAEYILTKSLPTTVANKKWDWQNTNPLLSTFQPMLSFILFLHFTYFYLEACPSSYCSNMGCNQHAWFIKNNYINSADPECHPTLTTVNKHIIKSCSILLMLLLQTVDYIQHFKTTAAC